MKKFKRPRKLKGLGDVVEMIAKPIAREIDKTIGTDLSNCNLCQKRRDRLNQLVPFEDDDSGTLP
jgi:hypothetical protein